MDLINNLIEEEKTLLNRLELVQAMLKSYGVSSGSSESVPLKNRGVFPTKARPDKQVLWLFENALSKGLKLKDVQVAYDERIGNDSKSIENTSRKLKREGKLIIVKYNNKHIYSYWGLPSWVNENDFKEAYKPDMDLLPEITASEVVRK